MSWLDDLIKAALEYARTGWAVLPLHTARNGQCSCGKPKCSSPGKHPRVSKGFLGATADPGQIKVWWKRWPDANVGIRTGRESGLLVLDLDTGKAGDESLARLESLHGALPPTLKQKTGGGGQHYFFRYPEDGKTFRCAVGLAPGLDVRADGGYVVAPPSLHASGARYRWADHGSALAECPRWLLEELGSEKSEPSRSAPFDGPRMIPEGARNDHLTRLAGAVRRRGSSVDTIASTLQSENRDRCRPPLAENEVERIAASVAEYPPEDSAAGGKGPRVPQSQLLVELVQPHVDLFRSPDMDGFASFVVGDHTETWPIRSAAFRRWAVGLFFESHGKPPGSQAVQDALGLLESLAQYKGGTQPVFVRIGEGAGRVYLDLGDDRWRVVEIDGSGWRVLAKSPVKFRRSNGMLPLPEPVAGGSVDDLSRVLNHGDDATFVLFVNWLLACFRSSGPYPILAISGEQGSAKSSAARILRSLVDPSAAPLRSPPRTEHDLLIAARNSWLIAFDNLSGMPNWLSDSLCRLSTGGGQTTRRLYSDAEEVIFDSMRPIALNGIEGVAERNDLVDRCLVVTLPQIPKKMRKAEREVLGLFRSLAPGVLGALLDAVSTGVGRIDQIKLAEAPRMADFATWAVACEPALPWPVGTFLSLYEANRSGAVQQTLQTDSLGIAVLDFMVERGEWHGTASQLLDELEGATDERTVKSKDWPKNAVWLGRRLRRLVTFLRALGVPVEFDDTARKIRLGSAAQNNGVTEMPSSDARNPLAAAGDRSSISMPGERKTPPGAHPDGIAGKDGKSLHFSDWTTV